MIHAIGMRRTRRSGAPVGGSRHAAGLRQWRRKAADSNRAANRRIGVENGRLLRVIHPTPTPAPSTGFPSGILQIVPYNRGISWENFHRWNRGRKRAVTLGMTTNNSLVFFTLGVAMIFAPVELPQFFPANAGDGSCTSALWLGVMGVAQAFLGLVAALHNETIRLRAAIESWDPIGRTFDMPEVQWVVPASLYARAGKNYAAPGNNMAASEMAA